MQSSENSPAPVETEGAQSRASDPASGENPPKPAYRPRKPAVKFEPRSLNAAAEAPYIWLAKAALVMMQRSGMDSSAVSVYLALCWLQNNAGIAEFYASLAQIAAHAGCGPRTVVRKLKLLSNLRLISILSGRKSKGLHEANRYILASTRSDLAADRLRHKDRPVEPSKSDSLAHNKEQPNKAVLLEQLIPQAAPAGSAAGSPVDDQPAVVTIERGTLDAFGYPLMKDGRRMGPQMAQRFLDKAKKDKTEQRRQKKQERTQRYMASSAKRGPVFVFAPVAPNSIKQSQSSLSAPLPATPSAPTAPKTGEQIESERQAARAAQAKREQDAAELDRIWAEDARRRAERKAR